MPQDFPNKFVNENLDYTVDFTFQAGAAAVPGAALAYFTVTALPVGPAALSITQKSVNGLLAVFYLGGGVAGVEYIVTVTASLASGQVMQGIARLQVLANPTPFNLPFVPAPPFEIDSTSGQVITDVFGNPITST